MTERRRYTSLAPVRHPRIGCTPLVVEQLRKRYGRTAAVDGLSFDVPAGSVCGFLGPNGAGKTTTLRILLGLTAADRGQRDTRPGAWPACSTATASTPAAPPTTNWCSPPPAPVAATPTRRSSAPG